MTEPSSIAFCRFAPLLPRSLGILSFVLFSAFFLRVLLLADLLRFLVTSFSLREEDNASMLVVESLDGVRLTIISPV